MTGPETEDATRQRRAAVTEVNTVVGLLVFALGIALMLLAFAWGYETLQGVDEQINQVRLARAVKTPASPPAEGVDQEPAEVAEANPQSQGYTLVEVIAGAVIKLVTLLILAGIGGMTAGRGAQLAGMRGR